MGREPLMALRFTDNKKPREPNSPASAIENRADADSDIGFARLCFVRQQVAYGRRRLGSYCNSQSDMVKQSNKSKFVRNRNFEVSIENK